MWRAPSNCQPERLRSSGGWCTSRSFRHSDGFPHRLRSPRGCCRSPCFPGCAPAKRSSGRFWALSRCWRGGKSAGSAGFAGQAVRRRPPRPLQRVAKPRAQHYVQSLCQLSVYAYWGWYWPPVYDFAPLLLGQLLFAYAFDMLLSWSRREPFLFGFGPFPIVFSTNLFLWFKDDWFALQFVTDRAGVRRQGLCPMAARRPARAHLQSLGIHARRVLTRAADDRNDAPDVGPGNRHDPEPGPAHLYGALRHRPRRHVLLCDHAGDGGSSGDALCARAPSTWR